jgi:pimeloyl-ACP methyl ester carboxylesterase
MALESRRTELATAVKDFRTPFSGLLGAWRLMSVMRFGDPAELLAAVPEMLPHLLLPKLTLHSAQDKAVPEQFACALIPQSKVLVVDSGHFIPLSNPETVTTELRRIFGSPALAQGSQASSPAAFAM